MVRLSEKRQLALLWMLRHKDRAWSILELQHQSHSLAYAPLHAFVKSLESAGFISRDPHSGEFRLSRLRDLIRLIALSGPTRHEHAVLFFSPKGMEATLELLQRAKLRYALSGLAGGELLRSYVKTDHVHAYVMEKDLGNWKEFLVKNNCLRADKTNANLWLIPAAHAHLFDLAHEIRGRPVVPIPLLLAELLREGALAEEQGAFLLEQWLENRLKL